MLVAPYAVNGLEIEIIDKLKKPYIDITMSVMEEFGVHVVNKDYRSFQIAPGQQYTPREYSIEPDASSASYFFAAAALTGGRVRVKNLTADSTQGDIRFVDILEKMGCRVNRYSSGIEVMGPEQLTGIDVDMNAISDTALTLAAIAPFARERVVIRNIQHTRWQETDRIHAMVAELQRLGVDVVEHQDGVEILPSEIKPAEIDTYDDHRVAMSFSLVGLKVPGIRIRNPGCVSKTFPNFFDVLANLR